MFLGIKMRDEGMQKVMDNQHSEWKELYRAAITNWFNSTHRHHVFTSEAMRLVARSRGISEPHHPNAWSANASSLLRSWAKEGRIEPTGFYVPAFLASSHARALKQYRKIK
jgi:hypothetical protein